MEEIKCEQIGQIVGSGFTEMTGRVYSTDGLTPSIRTFGGGNTEVKIVEPMVWDGFNQQVRADSTVCGTITRNVGADLKRNGQGIIEPNEEYIGCAVHPISKKLEFDGYKDTVCPTLLATDYKCPKTVAFQTSATEPTIWGSLQKNCAKKTDGICPTLTSAMGDGGGQIPMHNYDYRIRKLTERECFRLMGVKTEDFERVRYGQALPQGSHNRIVGRVMQKDEWKACWRIIRHDRQSVSSCYHLAGDSIVTSCLMAILGQLLGVEYDSKITELVDELKEGL